MIKFDLQHNCHLHPFQEPAAHEIFEKSHLLARIVVVQEYGMEGSEKTEIGAKISINLIRKVVLDMIIASGVEDAEFPEAQQKHRELYQLDQGHTDANTIKSLTRHVRTRLYFTSESHIVSVFNLLRCRESGVPPIISEEAEHQVGCNPELNYLSQIVIRVYKDTTYQAEDPRHFVAEMSYCTGARWDILNPEAYSILPPNSTSIFGDQEVRYPGLSDMKGLVEGLPLEQLLTFLEQYIQHPSSLPNAAKVQNS